MLVHLYDFRWNSAKEVEFQASSGLRFGRKKLSQGDALSVKVCGPTKCAGSMRDNLWQACPQQVIGRKKCEFCRNREGNFIFTSFDGFNTDMFSPEDLSRLSGPHVVYLALFGSGLIKVGVSKEERKTLRQVEQGSQQTLFLAKTPDGILARQIETLLRQSGLIDKIQAKAKRQFLCPEITPEQGEFELRQTLSQHLTALEKHPDLQKFLLDPAEFNDWSTTFGLPAVSQSLKPLHLVKLTLNEAVSGTILALKGPFVLLETPDEIVAVCAKDLQGLTVDFTPTSPGLSLNSALQNALF